MTFKDQFGLIYVFNNFRANQRRSCFQSSLINLNSIPRLCPFSHRISHPCVHLFYPMNRPAWLIDCESLSLSKPHIFFIMVSCASHVWVNISNALRFEDLTAVGYNTNATCILVGFSLGLFCFTLKFDSICSFESRLTFSWLHGFISHKITLHFKCLTPRGMPILRN